MNDFHDSYLNEINTDHQTPHPRALTEVESLVLSERHQNAFVALSQLTAAMQSGSPALQAANLIGFTIEHATLIEDVIAYGTDQNSDREAISAMSPDAKLALFGQILALTGVAMQAADRELTGIPTPSSRAVH